MAKALWWIIGIVVLLLVGSGAFILFDKIGNKFIVTLDGEVIEDNIIDWCAFEDSCGQIQIGISPWNKEWLNENAECIKSFKVPLMGKPHSICSKYQLNDFIIEDRGY